MNMKNSKLRINQYTAVKLSEKVKDKEIICFGSGNNFAYVFQVLQDFKLEEKIKFIVDNDEHKWGTVRKFRNKEYLIKEPHALVSEDWSKTVLLITITNYNGIIEQLSSLGFNKNLTCILYPKYRYWFDHIIEKFTAKLPLQNIIVLQGEGDTCENAMALVTYMKQRSMNKSYIIVWQCENPSKFEDSNNEKFILRDMPMKRHTLSEILKYYLFINRAKYLVYENKMTPKTRERQISCYMNHGIPLKATKGKICVYKDTDFVLSSSANLNHIIAEQFGARKDQIIVCGSPRTDCLFKENNANIENLRKYLNLDQYYKMVLWAPTFRTYEGFSRDDSNQKFRFGLPLIDSEDALSELLSILGEKNILLVVKPHIHQELSELIVGEFKHLKIVKQNVLNDFKSNVYDLMRASDAMITDYSSIGFDYLLLNKPIGYSIDDMDAYTIGFSVDNPLDFMPGVHMKEIADLVQFIKNISLNVDLFLEARDKLKHLLFTHADGGNSERLVNILKL